MSDLSEIFEASEAFDHKKSKKLQLWFEIYYEIHFEVF